MKNKLAMGAAAVLLTATSAFSQTTDQSMDHQAMDHQYMDSDHEHVDLYRANEVDVDLFGTASAGKYTLDHVSGSRVRNNTRLGAGAGLTYFFTRNVGIGGDVYSEDTHGSFIDSASGNIYARFPLGESGFSPYAFGGGGYQFDLSNVWFAQFGAGMEYRFCHNVGLFVDGRWVFPNETKYYGVGRLGVRLAF